MSTDKSTRQNRVREALGRIYDQQPPYFREYLRRFREDPTSRVFAPLAEAYRRLGRVDEAIEICREGLEHHPDFHGGRVALAKCFIDKRRYDDAKIELEKVVQSVPENLLAQRLLGDTYAVLRNASGALHCYKMALLLSPNDVTLAEKVHSLERSAGEAPPESDSLPEDVDTPEVEFSAQAVDEADAIAPVWEEAVPTGARASEVPSAAPEAEEEIEFIEPVAVSGKDPFTDEDLSPMDERSYRPEEDTKATPTIDEILGVTEGEADDSFKVESIEAIFNETEGVKPREITTETLGDLYFSQGQYDRALRIFEKLNVQRPLPELLKKINNCRVRMGVDQDRMLRQRKIEALRSVLRNVELSKMTAQVVAKSGAKA